MKSAERNGAYEYQYHKNTGKQKLLDDMNAGHLFFNHSDNLRNVELRYLHGNSLKKTFFKRWLNDYPDPYPQRYRKSISFAWVKQHGALLMVLKNSEVEFPQMQRTKPDETMIPRVSKSRKQNSSI